MSNNYDENGGRTDTNRKAYGNVTRSEVKKWERWLRRKGFSGPFTGLKSTHECVKLLVKELKKDTPTIIETHPRDPRTIANALTRFGSRRNKVQTVPVNANDVEFTKEIWSLSALLQLRSFGRVNQSLSSIVAAGGFEPPTKGL